MNIRAGSLLFASVLLVTACTTASLHELRQTTLTGDPFQVALAKEYLAFAESEAKQYDWASSKHFADKGLKAAYKQQVEPEPVEAWDIGEQHVAQLTTARQQLLSAMTPEKIVENPQLAARAQFFFDCWLEQQQEAWQEDDIASCREGFYRSVRAMMAVPEEPEEEPAIEAKPAPVPQTPLASPIFSSSYIVFFEFDKYVLTPEAISIVNTVANDLKASNEQEYEVILNGHADRAGSPEYNLRLSQRRAEAVKAALVERGIPANRIQYFAFGETDPRIPTPDNKREKANRRVEIFFNQ
jgi:OOP family OmpA-OmpF porin